MVAFARFATRNPVSLRIFTRPGWRTYRGICAFRLSEPNLFVSPVSLHSALRFVCTLSLPRIYPSLLKIDMFDVNIYDPCSGSLYYRSHVSLPSSAEHWAHVPSLCSTLLAHISPSCNTGAEYKYEHPNYLVVFIIFFI